MDNELNDYQEETEYDEYFSDEDGDVIYSEPDDEDIQNEYNPYLGLKVRPPIKWALIKLGTAILEISSIGTIKPYRSFNNSTEGTILEGTPYRYYKVEEGNNKYKNYYVHELVWQAFNGPPPPDYEIKHKPEYVEKYRKLYSNRLHNLTLVKKVEISSLQLTKYV